MGLLDGRPFCECCRDRDARGVRCDRARHRWICSGCWSILGIPPGAPKHPEDRDDWKIEVRRRLK